MGRLSVKALAGRQWMALDNRQGVRHHIWQEAIRLDCI
jgi:hypothetical protein